MKKLIGIILACGILLSVAGCGSEPSSSEVQHSDESSQNISVEPPFNESTEQSETSSEKGDSYSASSDIERLDFGKTHDEILDSINSVEPVEEITFFDIPGYSVSVYKPGVRPLNIYILADIETKMTKAVMVKGEKSYFGGNTNGFVNSIFRGINLEDQVGIEEFQRNKDEYQIFYLAPAILRQELLAMPISLSELNSNGSQLLTDEEIDELRSYLDRRDFQSIVGCLNSETTDPVMKKLYDISVKATELMGSVTVEYDEVEEKSILTYNELSQLSDNVHLLTIIDGSSLEFTMGFYASDWLFFDEITLKANNADGKKHYFKSTDVNTEAVTGGVLEYVTVGLHDSEIETLASSDSVTIRFKNSDTGDLLDFDLSEDELQAIRTLPLIQELRIQISDILFSMRSNPV